MWELYLIAGEMKTNVWNKVKLKKKIIFQTIALAETSKCSKVNTVILQSVVQNQEFGSIAEICSKTFWFFQINLTFGDITILFLQ